MKKKTRKPRLFEGLPVVDADESIDLHVLAKDVNGANKRDPANCAAAKAGKRELGTDVRVFLSRTYVKSKDHWVRYITPQSAQREIISFDRGSSFQPGTYTIPAPSSGQKLGTWRPRGSGGTTRTTFKRPYHATGLIRERGKYDAAIKKQKKRK